METSFDIEIFCNKCVRYGIHHFVLIAELEEDNQVLYQTTCSHCKHEKKDTMPKEGWERTSSEVLSLQKI